MTDSPDRPFRILVVDDDEAVRGVHTRLIRRLGHEVETAADGLEAVTLLPLEFDLIMLDAEMPNMDGFEAAERIREDPANRHIPILMVTGLVGSEHRKRALSVGINDFVSKPFDLDEFALKAKWLLPLKRAYDELQEHRASLEEQVRERTEALRRALEAMAVSERQTRRAYQETVRRLMVMAEYRDADTGGHIDRIGRYSEILARALDLEPEQRNLIREAATMHDIGKVAIPDTILFKPGRLDEEEWVIMRSHTTKGAQILQGSESPLIRMGATIALSHHERWDGRGYPSGLAGSDIPLESRICAVADFFDALTMNRPYRGAVPVEEVVHMMAEERGAHFDPDVLDVFMGVRGEIEAVRSGVVS